MHVLVKRRWRLGAIALSIIVTASVGVADADPRPVAVEDSIRMARLVDVGVSIGRTQTMFTDSPDGSKVAYVTRRGNLDSGVNEYSLCMLATREILTFLRAREARERPAVAVLATFKTRATTAMVERDGIEQLRWLSDGRSIAFIGRAEDGIGQVYRVDVETSALIQLTHHPDDVAGFALSPSTSAIVYSARTPPDWTARNEKGYAVTPSDLALFLGKSDPRAVADFYVRHFILSHPGAVAVPVKLDAEYQWHRNISIDPSGTWAVVPHMVSVLPQRWVQYEYIRGIPTRVASDGEFIEFQAAFAGPNPSISQYQLIDLRDGSARPLLDAPAVMSDIAATVEWSPSGRDVFLPMSYLPDTDSTSVIERSRREQQFMATVDIATGRVTPLRPAVPNLRRTAWEAAGHVRVVYVAPDDADVTIEEQYELRGSTWRRKAMTRVASKPGTYRSGMLQLRITEELNSPPEIAASVVGGKRELPISELNPQLREVAMGTVTLFPWSDHRGRKFIGGLVLPADYDASIRYPVVLQANGFNPKQFLMNGGREIGSPHAARPMASKGILVLQMPDPSRAVTAAGGVRAEAFNKEENELYLFVAEVEGAIDALAQAGLIDRDKVGLIGFSREGLRAHHALAFSKYPIAAATIASAVCPSLYCYTSYFGTPYPGGMFAFETRMVGAPFWGDGVRHWMEHSYLFHLDRIHSAIRYEEYGTLQVPGQWEAFAILRRHDRPVEMFHIPQASHAIKSPRAVYASKQGTVDWFAYWLRDEEDPDPAKLDQYRRWRQLRSLSQGRSVLTQDQHRGVDSQ